MDDLHIFVCIHDADLIVKIDPQLRMVANAPFTYIFVGRRSADLVRHWPNVVVARELPDNIEDENKFVDFTAWYAISRNGLGTARSLALIQYDTVISTKFSQKTIKKMASSPGSILGYIPWAMSDANFLKNNMGAAPLARSINNIYQTDIYGLVAQAIASGDDTWPSANSFCLDPARLNQFVDWFLPLMPDIGNVDAAGHSLERAIKIFCLIKGVECIYDSSVAAHFQLNSHGSQDFNENAEKRSQRRFANALQGSFLSRLFRRAFR